MEVAESGATEAATCGPVTTVDPHSYGVDTIRSHLAGGRPS